VISYCVAGFDASCMVTEPSDQRRMRALDCSSSGSVGERRQRMVERAVSYAEKPSEGGVLVWCSVVGAVNVAGFHALGSTAKKGGILRRYSCRFSARLYRGTVITSLSLGSGTT